MVTLLNWQWTLYEYYQNQFKTHLNLIWNVYLYYIDILVEHLDFFSTL